MTRTGHPRAGSCDPALPHPYGSRLAPPPARRDQPALAGRGSFALLTDPEVFVAGLRELL